MQAAQVEALRLSHEMLVAVESARAAEVAFKVQVQEFKNVLLRGHDPGEQERYVAAFDKRAGEVASELRQVEGAMKTLGLATSPLEEMRRLHVEITRAYKQSLSAFEAGRLESSQVVDRQVRGKDRPMEEKVDALVSSLERFAETEGARLQAQAAATTRQTVTVLLVLLLASGGAAAVVGTLIIRSLLRDLGGEPALVKDVTARVAAGDLTVEVPVREGDNASMLAGVRAMVQSLRGLVGEVAAGARGVADTSLQIAQGNTDLSRRTEEQASTLEETAGSMEELTSTVTQNAESARQASDVAATATTLARKGGQVVGDVVSTMNDITAASRRIGDIIGVIDGIAFQTNILALNAAVEAARAGEQGRGFAVVAAEVRNLAQRSATAAKEIKALIGDSVGKVDAGSKLVGVAGDTMNQLVASVMQVGNLIAEIAAASHEQSSGIEQVNTAVSQMDQVVQQNASLVEEASAATEAMSAQARSLLELVSRFKLGHDHQEHGSTLGASVRRAQPPQPPSIAAQRRPQLPRGKMPAAAAAGSGHWEEF
ncbi:MAG: methyl-accepting chemotaxis protein [Ramlibacter sp.]|nr:methyl-accepting chemotaxis protein [Ramlibacter sp.]